MISHPDFPQIQRQLRALGFYDMPIDDDWGPGMSTGIMRALTLLGQLTHTPPAPQPTFKIPFAYSSWIETVGPLPRHLVIALELYGTVETPGAGNNPVIMNWRDETKAAGANVTGYSADSVPWCGLFVAYVMLKAKRDIVKDPLWALNWSKWGQDGGQPELGDLLTFKRPGGGHVAFYIAEDRDGYYHVLGANQDDRVNIMRIRKERMHACRQPPYRNKPASVRPVIVSPTGTVSSNEA